MKWILLELLFIAVQLIGFIPFYFIWRKDCKEIGKEHLAVSLKKTLLGVVLIFPVLAVSDHISGEVQQMKRLCKDCLHCKSKQTGVVTFRYWCEITKVGVRPWMEKPHPKCPLKSGGAGHFES